MKNLITIIGSMMIMSIFLMQFAASEKTYVKEKISEIIVYKNMTSMEKADEVKTMLAQSLQCSKDMIEMEIDEETGNYSFKVPIYGIIGAEKIFGITKEKNYKYFKIEGIL